MDDVTCVGSEENLVDCIFHSFTFGHSHSEDAGVECYSEEGGNCSFGDMRLVNGNDSYEGRVEVCIAGEWGTVCDDGWSFNDARVSCRQLGFTDTASVPVLGGLFGSGEGDVFFRSVDCFGEEANLLECLHDSDIGTCTHNNDAGVRCHKGDKCIDGDVRLVNGQEDYEGRVEVCIGGVWGTICHDFWTLDDAAVVCSQLNLPSKYAVPFREAYFGQGNIPIVMNNVICDGTEANLTECSYDFHTADCTHRQDVGVVCLAEAECIHGDIRLVNGSTIGSSAGRVEVCNSGVWGSVCDKGFSIADAKVVCSALNLPSEYVIPYSGAYFGQSSGPVFYEYLQCDGSERNFTECTLVNEVTCVHSQDAGVSCLTERECDIDGSMRLVNGSGSHEGRLEVCLQGVWGSVADSIFDDISAAVLCEILGYANGGEASLSGLFGRGVGPIHLDEVFCFGDEISILDCSHVTDTFFVDHSNDVGLVCYKGEDCDYGDARLVDGSSESEGRVEVCLSGSWGTIADFFSFDGRAAQVLCRQLGYSDKAALMYSSSVYGLGSGPIAASSVSCDGDELNITECTYRLPSLFSSHFYDVGVKCFNETSVTGNCSLGSVRLVSNDSSSTSGRVEVCVDGQWGTVCSPTARDATANSACGSVGLASRGALSISTDSVGPGSGPIWIANVRCTFDDFSILDCRFNGLSSSCTHNEDLVVACQEKECNHGDVRLVDGEYANEGRIEVCDGGRWGTICGQLWNQNDALVLCRQLGYNSSYAQPYHYNHFSGATVPIALDSVNCNGDEESWTECSYDTVFVFLCSHADDAGLRCFNNVSSDVCSTGEHRLVDGTEYEGRVEVCIDGVWSSVCGRNSWGINEATVACEATYGASDVVLPYNGGYFGNGSGPIHVVDTQCSGDERSLLECDHSASQRDCDHSFDAGVRCLAGDECNTTGAIRLQGGSDLSEGRVEVCNNGVWGTVSVTSWGLREAAVVCGQLGYSSVFADGFPSSKFGPGEGVIHVTSVTCADTASKLLDCSSIQFYGRFRDHSNDVGVKCYEPDAARNCSLGDVQLFDGATPQEGRVEICFASGWGTISTRVWSVNEARIACYDAGFGGPGATTLEVPAGDGLVHMTSVTCRASHYSLLGCSFANDGSNNHQYDVGVSCPPRDNCTEGDIRLTDGLSEMDGYVEICFKSVWSTINERLVNTFEAATICNQLGYTGPSSSFLRGSNGPPTNRSIALTFLLCRPNDYRVTDCIFSFSLFGFVGHEFDIGVSCQPGIIPTSTTETQTRAQTFTQVSSLLSQSSIVTSLYSDAKTDLIVTTETLQTKVSSLSQSSIVTSLYSDTKTDLIVTTETSQTKETTDRSLSTDTKDQSLKTTMATVLNPSFSSSDVVFPSVFAQETLSITISGNFKASNFPKEKFKMSVADSVNQYCADNTCNRKRSLNLRQTTLVSADDVVIVSLTDNDNAGVVVSFFIQQTTEALPANVLYEAVKKGVEEGTFEKAGFEVIMIELPFASPEGNTSEEMSAGTIAGVTITVVIAVVVLVSVIILIVIIIWMKGKNRRYQLDKEHILSSSGSFIRDSEVACIENEYQSQQSLSVNEKLEFKKLEEETDDSDVPAHATSTVF